MQDAVCKMQYARWSLQDGICGRQIQMPVKPTETPLKYPLIFVNTLETFVKNPWNFLKQSSKLKLIEKNPWNTLETPFKHPYNTFWTPFTNPWNPLETLIKQPWNFPETLWNFLETPLKLSENTLKTSLKYHWHFLEIPLKLHTPCKHFWNTIETLQD